MPVSEITLLPLTSCLKENCQAFSDGTFQGTFLSAPQGESIELCGYWTGLNGMLSTIDLQLAENKQSFSGRGPDGETWLGVSDFDEMGNNSWPGQISAFRLNLDGKSTFASLGDRDLFGLTMGAFTIQALVCVATLPELGGYAHPLEARLQPQILYPLWLVSPRGLQRFATL